MVRAGSVLLLAPHDWCNMRCWKGANPECASGGGSFRRLNMACTALGGNASIFISHLAVSAFLLPGSTINSANDKGLTLGNLVSGSISTNKAPVPPLQVADMCSSLMTSQR